MPIQVDCVFCGKKYRVRDDRAGSSIVCKECGGEIDVPGAGSGDEFLEEAPAAALAPARPPRARAKAPRQGGASTLKVGIIVGAVVFVLGVVALLVMPEDEAQVADGGQDAAGDAGNAEGQAPVPVNNGNPNNNGNLAAPRIPNQGGGNRVGPNPDAGNGGAGDNRQAGGGNVGQPNIRPGGIKPIQQPDPKPRVKPQVGGLQAASGGPKIVVAPTPDEWVIQPDPGAYEKVERLSDKDLSMRIPTPIGTAIFPNAPSPFAAIGSNNNDRERRSIVNVESGKRVGAIGQIRLSGHSGEPFNENGVLSADGKYFAAQYEREHILVWDVENSKQLGLLGLLEEHRRLNMLAFAGSQFLLAATDKEVLIWKTAAWNEDGRSLDIPRMYRKQCVAISPGGKYFVMVHQETPDGLQALRWFDLTTLEVAGELQPPRPENQHPVCLGLTFSNDGKELAGLFNAGRGSMLVVWDVASARTVVQLQFEEHLERLIKGARHYRGRAIEWFADKQRWLVFGHGIIDREIGGPVWQMPEPKFGTQISARRILSNDLAVGAFGKSGSMMLVSQAFPMETITKATDVVRGGGLSIDASLPPLKEADWSGVQLVSVEGSGSNWSVRPDGVGATSEPLLERAIRVASDGVVKNALLSSPEAGRAVVMSQADRNANAESPFWLDGFDLKSGSQLERIPIPFPADLVAFSPDGKSAIVRLTEGKDRLDQYALDDQSHMLGWRPYMNVENKGHREVTGVEFIDSTHVMTLSNARKLVMWDLTACRAVYSIENVNQPSVSPGGKYLIAFNGKYFRFVEALTGNLVGEIEVSGNPMSTSFHPGGERFAVMSVTQSGTNLECFNLSTAKREFEIPMPRSAGSMHWCGDDYVLLDNNALVDIAKGMIIWSYFLPGGIHLNATPDNRHWFLARESGRKAGVALCAATIPEPAVKQRLDALDLERDTIVHPGMQMSLNVQLTGMQKANLAGQVQKNITDKLSSYDIDVAAGQAVQLTLATVSRSTGKSHKFESIGSFDTQSVAGKEVFVNATITQNGTQVWERKIPFRNVGFGITFRTKKESLQTQLDREMWQAVENYVLHFVPPKYVFPGGGENGLGQSRLTVGGALPQ